ncbi:MAG: BTAD domain-containing putative transcriptional regulator [Chloroflexota bacterium]
MSNLLTIHLFGYPALFLSESPLSLKLPHKALALLYYVAVEEQPVGRETLATLLWPDSPATTAKQSLRNLLSQLRKSLGDYMEITPRTVTLRHENIQSVDVVDFQRGIQHRSSRRSLQPYELDAWQMALDLYRGDFLAGFHVHQSDPFDVWMIAQREYLRQLLLTNLYALAEAHETAGQVDKGLIVLERLLLFEPWSEEAYQKQMLLLVSLGKRVEAIHRYEICRQVLQEELGLPPSPELTSLYEELRQTKPRQNQPVSPEPPTIGMPRHSYQQTTPVYQGKPASHQQRTHNQIVADASTNSVSTNSASTNSASTNSPSINNVATERTITEKTTTETVTTETITVERTFTSSNTGSDTVSDQTSTSSHRTQTPQHNLGYPLHTFVGRKKELNHIVQQLIQPSCRLFTIIGAGGMGKTTLAQTAGLRLLETHPEAFPDGFFFISLAGIDTNEINLASDSQPNHQGDPQRNPPVHAAAEPESYEAIGTVIAEQIGCDIQGQVSCWTQLQNYLRNRQLLLILDNFEQLVDARQSIVSLLTHASGLTVLVTSRVRLNVRGEKLLLLDQLSLPPQPDTAATSTSITTSIEEPAVHVESESAEDLLAQSEAFAFFVQRAQDVDPFFELDPQSAKSIVQICHLVEGLPLGIELAAGMLPLLSCTQLAEELTQSLTTLSGDISDIPEDQRSLERVFERSWSLLTPKEQGLIARLSIFPNTFSFHAAQTIMNASRPLMMSLFNQSLLKRANANSGSMAGDEIRYTLHRSIREFARRKLAQDAEQVKQTERDFAEYYLAFLRERLILITRKEQTTVIAQIMAEIDNVRTGWRQGVRHHLIQELTMCSTVLNHLMESQGIYADMFDLFHYAYTYYENLDMEHGYPPNHPISILLGHLQTHMAMSVARQGKAAQAERYMRASFAKLEPTDAIYPKFMCRVLLGSFLRSSNLQKAHQLLKEAKCLGESYNENTKALSIICLAEIECLLGDYRKVQQDLSQLVDVIKPLGWGWGMTLCQRLLGLAEMRMGNYVGAAACFEVCIEIAHERNMKHALADALIFMGDPLRLQGRLDDARQCYQEGLAVAEYYQFGVLIAQGRWGQGCLAEQTGNYIEAKALLANSFDKHQQSQRAKALPTLGWALMGLGEFAEAEAHFQQIYEETLETHALPIRLEAQAGLACLTLKRTQQAGTTNQGEPKQFTLDLQAIAQHPATAAETRQRVSDFIETL